MILNVKILILLLYSITGTGFLCKQWINSSKHCIRTFVDLRAESGSAEAFQYVSSSSPDQWIDISPNRNKGVIKRLIRPGNSRFQKPLSGDTAEISWKIFVIQIENGKVYLIRLQIIFVSAISSCINQARFN